MPVSSRTAGGAPKSTPTWPRSSRSRTACSWQPPPRTASPISSIAAARRASSGFSTRRTLAFADYGGNRQYITQGNLSENPKANIFLIDYAHRRRVKIWGEARVVDDDPALLQSLMPQGYKARPEQVILFRIAAWDTNCPQHIPQKFEATSAITKWVRRSRRKSTSPTIAPVICWVRKWIGKWKEHPSRVACQWLQSIRRRQRRWGRFASTPRLATRPSSAS